MLRKAQYAGSFYNNDPQKLRSQMDKWFKEAQLPEGLGRPQAILCPHAGYMYSGACAAYAYKLMSQYEYKNAIILHPSHKGNHFSYSISPFETYQTPLGELELNIDWADRMTPLDHNAETWYHQQEHSMEVQLPFLAYVAPHIKILPIMIGLQNDRVSSYLAGVIDELISSSPEDTILIVSTDLSHYYDAHSAESMDKELIKHVVDKDAHGFYEALRYGRIEACGFAGVMTMLQLSVSKEGYEYVELQYTHSGRVTGDNSQVVGYLSAAMLPQVQHA